MAKKPEITLIGTAANIVGITNINNDNIATAFDNTLSRDGSVPNNMLADLDMDGNDVLNVKTIEAQDISIAGSSLGSILTEAQQAVIDAEASAAAALISETNSEASAIEAAATLDSFDDRYLGAKASAPTVDNDGDALVTGALYWNTVSNNLFVWDGAAWTAGSFTASGTLLATNNLSDVADAATARSNLGLAIGVDVQAYDATYVVDADIGVTVQAYSADNAFLTSPAFTGTPTAPTPTAADNSTKIATTAYVDLAAAGAAGAGLFKGENGETGDTVSGAGDIFRINEQTLNTSTTIDADENASATGPLAVATGVTLTVASGGTLVIL